MKKSLLSVFAMATMLLATGCSQEDELVNNSSDYVEASFSIDLNEGVQSRTLGLGKKVNQLYYGIYDHNTGKVVPVITDVNNPNGNFNTSNVGEAEVKEGTATVKMKLVKGQTYDFVFWAQVKDNTHYTIDKNDLKNITVNYNGAANDETRDAFFACEPNHTVVSHFTKTIILKRPFAQINVGTTKADFEAAKILLGESPITQSKMIVKNVPTTLNLLEGTVDNPIEATFNMATLPKDDETIAANKEYDILKVQDVEYAHLAMNYVLSATKGEQEVVEATLEFANASGSINTFTVPQLPIYRNYRTNIIGNILTTEGDFTIIVDEEFEKPDEIYDTEEKALMLAAANGGEFTLTKDVKTPYLETNADFTLNINEGVTFTSGSAADYGLIVLNGTTTINGDGNFTSNGGGIGVVDGAEVIFNGGNLYVDTESTSGRYLFYLEGEGSTATINGGEFSWDKADNQKRAYIYASAGTTVYVKGGTFGKASTRSGYTAGILGEGTVIITGGTFGFDPSTWVADGYQAVKDGANYIVLPEIVVSLANVTTNTEVELNNDITVSSGTTIQTQNATADITINGNSKTIVSTATSADAFQWEGGTIPAMSTILSSKNGEKVVVNDLNFTGTMSALMLGNYVDSNSNWFNTELNNVNVIDAEVVSFSAGISPAVCIYGKATLNKCNIYGTTLSPLDTDPMWPVYDLAITNNSTVIIKGGKIGSIYSWAKTKIEISEGAEIESIKPNGNMNRNFDGINIKSGTKVGTIDLSLITDKAKVNFKIEDGATVSKIVANGVEYASITEWQAAQ